MNSSKNAYKKIKKQNLEPKSKYNFILKNYLFWFLSILATVVGAMAVAIIIFFLYNQDWVLYFRYANLIQIIYFSLPYIWFLILMTLISLAYLNFRKTEFGYRYSLKKILIIYLITSVILGSFLYYLGFSQTLNKTLDQKIPFYTNLHQRCSWFWQNPQAGRLGGEIIKIENNTSFKLKDLNNKEWIIYDDKAIYRKKGNRNIGANIRIIGKMLNKNKFIAKEIKPFMHQEISHNLFKNKKHLNNINERNY